MYSRRVVSLSIWNHNNMINYFNFYFAYNYFSYDIMMSCWNEDHHKRPRFSNLVSTFSDLLESDAGYLQLSPLPILNEKGDLQKSPAKTEQLIIMMNEAAEAIELDHVT